MRKRILVFAILFVALLFVIFRSMNSPERPAVEAVSDAHEKWSGSFDGMVQRHLIRVLAPYSKTFYFLDGTDQRRLTYEALQGFERYVNRRLKKQTLKIRLVVIPTSRDRLLSALAEGLGDIAATGFHQRSDTVWGYGIVDWWYPDRRAQRRDHRLPRIFSRCRDAASGTGLADADHNNRLRRHIGISFAGGLGHIE